MTMRITSLILLHILLLLASLSSGFELGYNYGLSEGAALKKKSFEKDINDERSRRLMIMLDYEDGGANPKHEPKGGKKSGGGFGNGNGNGNGKNP